MALSLITMTFNELNVSLQIGDVVYYSTNPQLGVGAGVTVEIGNSGTFNTLAPVYNSQDTVSLNNTNMLGEITAINGNSITVLFDDALGTPGPNDFISFAKNKQVNTTSLKGYYADVQFVNNSTEKAEIFSVGSSVALSSK